MNKLLALLLLPAFLWSDCDCFEGMLYFLTWQEDPCHTMSCTYLTKREVTNLQWCEKDQNQWHDVESSKDEIAPYVYHSTMRGLKPDTIYTLRINGCMPGVQFKTAPLDIKNEISFVVGGDVYHDDDEAVIDMFKAIAKINPLFLVIGGDIAYSYSSKYSKEENNERWYDFLALWQKEMISSEGLVIPLIATIGNHDVLGGYNDKGYQSSTIFSLFPFPLKQGYGSLTFNNYMELLLLNTGHSKSVSGAQTSWLKEALAKSIDIPYSFAVYHVSAFPSIRPCTGKRHQEIYNNFVPLFEQYQLTCAFEHHDHALKRTHLIKNGRVDASGVLYLGDGSMGIKKPRTSRLVRPWYIAKMSSDQAVWCVKLNETQASFTAINPSLCTLDIVKRKPKI